MLYNLSLEKVRKKTITDAMYRVDDDVGKDCLPLSAGAKRLRYAEGKRVSDSLCRN